MVLATQKHPILPRLWLIYLFLTPFFSLSAQTDKPIPVETLYKQARTFAAEQRLDTALILMEKVCMAQPKDMDMQLYLARLYAWKKDFTNAEDHISTILEKQPKNQDAQLVLADVYLWSKQWTNLEKITKNALNTVTPSRDDDRSVKGVDSIPFIQKYAYGLIEQNRYKEAEKLLFPIRDRLFSLWNLVKLKLMVNTLSVHYAYYNFKTQTDWNVTEVDYSRQFPKIAFIGSLNYAHRFNKTGTQFMAQAYPKIGNRAYMWLLAGISDGKTFPDLVYGSSFFVTVKKYWEVEAGIRFFKVKNNEKATILRGGLAYFKNKNRFAYGIAQVRGTGATGLTHVLSYQNHFKNDESFVRLGVGTGSSTDILLTPQYDNFIINSLSLSAVANYKFNRHWAVSGGCSWEQNGNKIDNNLQSRWVLDARLAYKF
jgi:YaiO family outer membrane protein